MRLSAVLWYDEALRPILIKDTCFGSAFASASELDSEKTMLASPYSPVDQWFELSMVATKSSKVNQNVAQFVHQGSSSQSCQYPIYLFKFNHPKDILIVMIPNNSMKNSYSRFRFSTAITAVENIEIKIAVLEKVVDYDNK